MTLTDEQIKKIIFEVLREQDEEKPEDPRPESEFGKDKVSAGDRAKEMKSQAANTAAQKGIDNNERGIIKQFNDRLQKLAQLSNIKGGSINTLLKKVYSLMDKEIQKLEGGSE